MRWIFGALGGILVFDVGTSVGFFLGANTPQGFCGYHHELYDGRDGWRAYLIKSGPGTGKSSLMKRILADLASQGVETEALFCSSDPHSLDGVVVPSIQTVIFDATAPHILEPGYWGAVEQIVDLSSCMDGERLHKEYAAVIEATDACSKAHARCRRFMGAAATLLGDNRRWAAICTDTDKIVRCAAGIAAREWGGKTGDVGKETRRFLSALTPEGTVVFYETLQTLCPRLYAIEDEHGAAAGVLMAELRRLALEAGWSVITCTCPLFPQEKIDHLLIPELGLGFTISNAYHRVDFPVYRRIHATRFTDVKKLRETKQKLAFNRKAARELLHEAETAAVGAKELHDKMEELSKSAVDWEKVNALQEHMVTVFHDLVQRKKEEMDV